MATCTTCGHYAAPPNTLCVDCTEKRDRANGLLPPVADEKDDERVRVTIVDVDIPIASLIRLQFRWIVASLPFVFAAILLYFIIRANSTP